MSCGMLPIYNHLIITGDEEYFNDTLLPISNAIAHFFGQLLDFNETSGAYELWNATDLQPLDHHWRRRILQRHPATNLERHRAFLWSIAGLQRNLWRV